MAIVRAKRLVFEQAGGRWWASAQHCQYLIEPFDGRFRWRCETAYWSDQFQCADTFDAAVEAAQARRHLEWLADTEVPELEWTLIDQDCWSAKSYRFTNPYYVWAFDDGTARYSLAENGGCRGMSPDCDTKQAAIDACNNHNRTAILGG